MIFCYLCLILVRESRRQSTFLSLSIDDCDYMKKINSVIMIWKLYFEKVKEILSCDNKISILFLRGKIIFCGNDLETLL